LTPVEASAFPVITGSNGFEGVGWEVWHVKKKDYYA
jgi:hypothetical protein